MPSTPYDLVKDDQDLRVPLHPEKAFFAGITFQAKFIGWEEVPRPNTRTEIVQAMRRIRYECKVQNMKKRKVTIHISVNGVKVSLRKKKRRKKQWENDADDIVLMNHPIYRIFYVSHDSSDLKIFSYIARDGSNDTFKCSVFKSNKKSQAMRIVRTVGQAFEVCHKYSNQKNSLENNDERSDLSDMDILDPDRISELSDDELLKKEHHSTLPDSNSSLQRPNHLDIVPQTANSNRKAPGDENNEKPPGSPISSAKEIQKLKEQLEQQALQTRQALAQLMLVREQLISETNARMEAQARTQQLLQQNRELLEHLASLGGYTEQSQSGLTSANIALAPQSQLQLLLQQNQDQTTSATIDHLSPSIRKSFLSTTSSNAPSPNNSNSNNNNNLAVSITQQLNNLGSINQQLTTLSHQLSGLNQQSQNLQNFQNLNGNLQAALQHHPMASNAFPNLNQIQAISKKLSNLQSHHTPALTATAADTLTQNDLFQINQDLLNRLQTLNLGLNTSSYQTPITTTNGIQNSSISSSSSNNNNNNNNSLQNSSFFFTNPGHLSNSPNNNNNNFNFLNSSGSFGTLTPSPMGTMSRKSYSSSPMPPDNSLALSIDKNLNSMDEAHFIKPISQVGTITTLNSDGKVKVIVPVTNGDGCSSSCDGSSSNCSKRDLSSAGTSSNGNIAACSSQNSRNDVTLKLTDEAGNSRKLSATPSFITRSTSEKVPNRSQIMSEVQRTTWARHTTK